MLNSQKQKKKTTTQTTHRETKGDRMIEINKEYAEKLECPFMVYQESSLHELHNCKCSSDSCIAWVKSYPMDNNCTKGYCSKIGKTD